MKRILMLLISMSSTISHATLIVYGNSSSAPFGFSSPLVVSAYDESTGTFYTGAQNTTAQQSGSFSLAKALRPSQSQLAQFIGIGTNTILLNQTLENLTVMPLQPTDLVDEENSILLPTLALTILNGETPFTQTSVTASSNNGSQVVSSVSLLDANPTTTASSTAGIVNIASNSCYILAAVRPSVGGNFGDLHSGIALINVQPNPLTLTVLDANTGLPGNSAIPFNGSITPLKGDNPTSSNVTFSASALDANEVDMIYDSILSRFYIGTRIDTGNQVNDIGKSIVVAQTVPEECNEIEFSPIVADSAINATTPTTNQIVVAKSTGTQLPLRALSLGVMHSSPGPDYLIINGGQGETFQVGDLFYALPLVNTGQDDSLNGTLANANAPLSSQNKFTIPALNSGDLLTNEDPRALVGSGPLPIQPDQQISDMHVVGDAVYVSIDIAPDCNEPNEPTNDSGIFYSQALFDQMGKISRWSPWKRATPFDAFSDIELAPCLSHDGQVKFFSIDAKTGNAWIVEGTTDTLIGYTEWTAGDSKSGLLYQANKLLPNGSYSVLDLNQQTRGFESTHDRYALFGGIERVVIARVSLSCTTTTDLSPEIVITNYEGDDNLFVDLLPELDLASCPVGAGTVTSLEYSRRIESEGNSNYFFAGTEKGLFAFSITNALVHQAGFNVNQLGALNESPFIDGSWSRIEEIEGAVLDIKTSGERLYVLTVSSTPDHPFINTLYSIGYQDTLNDMFTNPGTSSIDIIAQNNNGIFANTTAFFAIALISTGNVGNDLLAPSKEQLFLATSNGLYISNANQNPGNGLPDATNQSEANWQLIEGSAAIPFDGIGFMDVPIAQTVWPISIADARHFKTFDRSNIYQISASGNDDGSALEVGTFEPAFFNAHSPAKKFQTLDPIRYFWSDGGRRFFIINQTISGNGRTQLAVMPYDVEQNDVTQFSPIFSPLLREFHAINWVRSIGATGLIIAGTNRGLVGLE